MSQQDRAFMTTFLGVLAILVVIAFAFYFVADTVTGTDEDSASNPRMEAKILDNIAPVAKVKVGAASVEQAAPRAPRAGSEIFAATCTACHTAGVAGAPKVGDKAAWSPRAAQGLATLLSHATNGLRAMPPKGTCADCSEEELKGAITYMLGETGIEVEGGAAAPAAAAPAPAAAAAPVEVASDPGKGKEVFQTSCFACHGTGAAGAPKVGDSAAWGPRIAKGIDTLLNNAINGLNAMPPKGTCFSCSDADLQAAIEYMTSQSQ